VWTSVESIDGGKRVDQTELNSTGYHPVLIVVLQGALHERATACAPLQTTRELMAQGIRDREDEARCGYRSAVMDEVERCGYAGVTELARERHTKSNRDEGHGAFFTYSF
jgi:hypothetical protein